MDLGVTPVLILDALNIKPGFGQTAIFPWSPYVPLSVKALASGCCLPVRRLEESKQIIPILQQSRTSRELYIIQISLQDL